MSLKDAFAGIKEAQSAPAPALVSTPDVRVAPVLPGLPLQKTGKSSHPEFEQVTIYVRKKTRKAAWRKWEDADGGDYSDLVEHLMGKYLNS